MNSSSQTIKVVVDAENNTAKAFAAVEKSVAKAEKNISTFQDRLGKLQPTFQKMALAGTAAFAAIGAGAFSLAKEAANTQRTAQSFDALTKSIGSTPDAIYGLREATRGLVDDTALMQSGSRLISMGLAETEDEMNKLSEMAVKLGSAMGNEATPSMENFALMLANQSILRLDSFGISGAKVRERILELTTGTNALTREQAFMQATMEEGEKSMARLGDTSNTAGEKMQAMQANIINMRNEVGNALIPILEDLMEILTPIIKAVSNFAKENPQLVKTLVIVSLAVAGVVAVLGTLGIALFGVTNAIVGMKGAVMTIVVVLKKFAALGLAGGVVAVALAAVAALIGYVIFKLYEFGKEVGGIGNAWSLTVLNMEIKFWKFVQTVVTGIDNIFSKIPGLGSVFGETIDNINSKITDAEANFDSLAVQGIQAAADEGKDFGATMTDALSQITSGLDLAGSTGESMADKMDESFTATVEGIKEIRDEITATWDDINAAVSQYRDSTADEESSHQDKVVKLVANAKDKLKDLESDMRDAKKDDDAADIKRIREQMEAQEDIITSYKRSDLQLDEEISEQRRFLQKNEFEQLQELHDKKLLSMQKEFLTDQVFKLQKLVLLKQEHGQIMNTISSQERAVIEAEISKSKTFREQLDFQKKGLGTWMDQTVSMYEDYVKQVNSTLSDIKSDGGGSSRGKRAAGGSVAANSPYTVGEKGAETFVPSTFGRIISADRSMGGGNTTVVFTGNTFMDEEDVAEKVGDKIARTLKDNMRV